MQVFPLLKHFQYPCGLILMILETELFNIFRILYSSKTLEPLEAVPNIIFERSTWRECSSHGKSNAK